MSERIFYVVVPPGAKDLKFTVSGGQGNADLYVRYGAKPHLGKYECASKLSGNNESCDIKLVRSGRYYVVLRGTQAFSGAQLMVSYSTPGL